MTATLVSPVAASAPKERYTHPSTRPDQITSLINSVDRYNPSNCHLLEDYLQEQLSTSSYDLLPNLALLKLYQFNPPLLSPHSVLSILFLSLLHAPFSPDFSLSISLLGDSFIAGHPLPPLPAQPLDSDDEEDDTPQQVAREPAGEKEAAEELKVLSGLLAKRKFREFWKKIESEKGIVGELKESAKGWEVGLRKVIADEVEGSFKAVKRSVLEGFLGLEAGSNLLEPLIQEKNWTLDDKDVVHIPENESNSPTSTLQRERIEISQLAKVLERSQVV